jgi:hypothetical protein
MTTNADAGIDVVELTEEKERAMLERSARQLLGLSADEFARRWSSGAYRDCDDPRVTQVAMLLP